jgi:hypothetical protein
MCVYEVLLNREFGFKHLGLYSDWCAWKYVDLYTNDGQRLESSETMFILKSDVNGNCNIPETTVNKTVTTWRYHTLPIKIRKSHVTAVKASTLPRFFS